MSSHITGSSVDFHLPDEILSVIPTDPYDQLDIARKITSMAIASRVSKLESEISRLRQNLLEKDRTIHDLQEKLTERDKISQEADAKLHSVLQENIKFSKEHSTMTSTMKKLNRDLAKLEAFKRQVMQSLNEDNSPTETVDIGTCDQAPLEDTLETGQKVLKHEVQKHSTHTTPRFTPTLTPKIMSTSGSPRSYSEAESQKRMSGSTSPNKSFEARGTLSSWYPSSTQSSAHSSPPHGKTASTRTPRVDGKEFFRQARNRLSYEQFGAFLAIIKELNAHRQSREETLRKSEEIFGIDNRDLYLSFRSLLNRTTA